MSYQYQCPTLQGFRRVHLSRADHNRILKNRQLKWFARCEYFMKADQFLIHTFTNAPAVALSVLAFPVMLLLHGVLNRDLWSEQRRLMSQRRSGSFIKDQFTLRDHDEPSQELIKAVKP